ncbi:putative Bifunctional abietadiene synthase, chloroplastic [Cocos nucifera]|uniref:Putative Bifunctional abietadiene synthase, chloroplastic n=1 Tax=Cocos nucifera TaxID=13894 RepID=A0A8K0IZ02_COCNU|nr:putative Bifunctional abietadiene synthase, chloroplastic [Cocos nucifera]
MGTKSLQVNFALELPRQCLLPRLESRSIIRQLWPGNETTRRYLKLAKLDLRKLQNLYQQELEELESCVLDISIFFVSFFRWWQRCGFDDMKRARKILIQAYFIATPRVYEPQFSSFRLAYAKGVVLTTVLDDFFDDKSCGFQELQRFYEAFRRWDSSIIDDLPQQKQLFKSIDDAYLEIAAEASKVQGRNVLPLFKDLVIMNFLN